MPAAALAALLAVVAALALALMALALARTLSCVRFVSAGELGAQPSFAAHAASLTPADLRARGRASRDEYARAYLAAVRFPPPPGAAVAAARAAARARRACRGTALEALFPVRVALLAEGGAEGEGGWPHTHGRVVCLPVSAGGVPVETLVHEMVHVLQRADAAAAARLVRALGYERLDAAAAAAAVPPGALELRRANPDLDGRLYARAADGAVPVQLYRSRAPASLADSDAVAFVVGGAAAGAARYEHPYEEAAYRAAAALVRGAPDPAVLAALAPGGAVTPSS